LECAIKSGINFIDTAYWYGQGRSEEILGKASSVLFSNDHRNIFFFKMTALGRMKIMCQIFSLLFSFVFVMSFRLFTSILNCSSDKLMALGPLWSKISSIFIDLCSSKDPVLSKIPRKGYYISTKVGRFELDYARSFDLRADRILENLTASLKKLRLSYIDVCFVQIHDVEFAPHENIILYETLPALEIAKHSGKIRYIGLTGYPLRKLASVVENSTVPIDVVMTYCHASLNDNALGEFVKFFESRNIGVLNASPLSMGLLTEKGPPPWHPASQIIRETALAAVQYCSNANWEGVDVHKYWKRLQTLGLTALATHRHSSVESLTSTMTSFSLT
uniref:Aldo_ket_red domain-containing protein n=1 Tax=Anisakis simplex TaxID=6269 RepID=A0A0M3K8A9_ANISI